MSFKKYRIIIAGGGTGGHIYPALAIAEALIHEHKQCEILFVGTSLGLESKIIPKAGFNLKLIQSGKLNFKGQILNKIKTLFKIPIGIFQSFWIILTFKPHFVLGVGGYASAPMLLAASLMGCKTALWEPNAHPGMANRILSRFVSKAFLVFEDAKKYLKSSEVHVLGMPLRSEIENYSIQSKKQIDHKMFTILCFGGSQGSVFLNDQLSDFVLENPDLNNQIKVFHQTGSLDFQRMKTKYSNTSNVEVFEYIYNMPDYYKQADVLFCRGGASTLAEAAAFGVVPIVVPLPAADDHQQKNAEVLVQENAGYMFLQKNFNKDEFKKVILNLVDNEALRKCMSKNLEKIAPKNSSTKIAQNILQQIN